MRVGRTQAVGLVVLHISGGETGRGPLRRGRCGPKPRVAAQRLPWDRGATSMPTPKGLCPFAYDRRSDRDQRRRNPVGVGGGPALLTQGSACGATLGWRSQPRWGNQEARELCRTTRQLAWAGVARPFRPTLACSAQCMVVARRADDCNPKGLRGFLVPCEGRVSPAARCIDASTTGQTHHGRAAMRAIALACSARFRRSPVLGMVALAEMVLLASKST